MNSKSFVHLFKSLFLLSILAAGVALSSKPGLAGMTPREILAKADGARGNVEGIEWEITLKSTENGRTQYRDLKVKARGRYSLAEFLSPPKVKGRKLRSNPKREVPGMDFARLVWVASPQWTISLIGNLDEGRQEFFGTGFNKTYAGKVDFSGSETYASMIFSYSEHDRARLGAFAGLTASDALLLYCEGNISRGTNALYPEKSTSPFGASMEQVDDEDSSLKYVCLAGGSYTFLTGPTLTVEYLYNSPGYSDNQARDYYLLRRKASGGYSIQGGTHDLAGFILGRTADPGLRFLRRDYLMVQYSQNDIRDRLNLLFRWTRNLDDGSGQFISIVECFLGDHAQLFSIGTINSGREDTEFGSILDSQWIIGLEYTF